MGGQRFRGLRAPGVAVLALLAATASLIGQRGVGPPDTTSQTPPIPATGAISGTVIDGSTGRPISGAIVALTSGGARSVFQEPRRLATDAQGRFVFTRLLAVSYTLTASKHGYSTGRYGQADPSTTSSRTIQIADGQWFPDGRIVMWRTSAISGIVTDESGEPLVGAMVRVLARVTVAGRPQLAAGMVAKTDDLGRYRAAGLPVGSYVVMVPSVQAAVPSGITLEELSGYTAESRKAAEAAGRPITAPDPLALVVDASNRLVAGTYITPPPMSAERWSYPPVFFPNARSIADAAVVDLGRAEERTGLNIQLAPVRTVRVTGFVQGPTGSTPAGMTVRLLPAGNEALGYGSEAATALVASDGAFTLINVPTGAYTISVSRSSMEFMAGDGSSMYAAPIPPGCLGGGGGFFTLGAFSSSVRASYRSCRGDTAFSARMPFTVGDRDVQGVLVPLQRAVSISGRVVLADGPPAPDSLAARIGLGPIFAEPANGDPLMGLPTGRSLPDDPTRFKVDGLLQGAYILQLSPPSGGVKSIEWQGRDFTDRPFDTTPGRDIEDVVITMSNQLTRVRGSVRDVKGAPAVTGQVIVFPIDRSMWTNNGLRPARLKSGQVDTAGTYAFPLPGGEYFIAAIDQAGATDWMDPKFLEASSATAMRITVAWGETKTVDVAITPVKVAR